MHMMQNLSDVRQRTLATGLALVFVVAIFPQTVFAQSLFDRVVNFFTQDDSEDAGFQIDESGFESDAPFFEEPGGNVGVPQTVSDKEKLPELGRYSNKLLALKKNVAEATDILKKKHDAVRKNVKAGQLQQGDAAIDGPLYLLQKMSKNLETDSDGSLKDGQGLSKFFAHLRALKTYNDPAFAEVIQRTQEFTGFSYLFPSLSLSPDKPLLIFIPPTGEPVAWSSLLGGRPAEVVGYVYDNTASADEMITTLLAKLKDAGLDKKRSVMVAYSFGNTVLLRAAEQAISSGENPFAQAAFVSLGFLPGGASDFLGFVGKLPFIRSVGRFIYPPGAGVLEMLPPDTSSQGPQGRLVSNLGKIDQKTLGISYVQSTPEGEYHINRQNTSHPFYGPTVRQFFSEVEAAKKITYVVEDHGRIPNAGAVKEVIDKSLAIVSPRKPGAFRLQYLALRLVPGYARYRSSTAYTYSVPSLLKTLAAVEASSVANSRPDILDVLPALLGGTIDKCDVLREALEESMLRIPGMDDEATVGAVQDYLAESNPPCTFEEIEKNAQAALQADGFATGLPDTGTPNSFEFERNSKGTFDFSLVAPDGDTLFTQELAPVPFGSYLPRKATADLSASESSTAELTGTPTPPPKTGFLQQVWEYLTAPRVQTPPPSGDNTDTGGFVEEDNSVVSGESDGFIEEDAEFGDETMPTDTALLPQKNAAPLVVSIGGSAATAGEEGVWRVTVKDPDGVKLHLRVDWDDGTGISYEDGAARSAGESTTVSVTHQFAKAGSYRVAFTVSDWRGGEDTLRQTITVALHKERAVPVQNAPENTPEAASPQTGNVGAGNAGAGDVGDGNVGTASAEAVVRILLDEKVAGNSGAFPRYSEHTIGWRAQGVISCTANWSANHSPLNLGDTVELKNDKKYAVTCSGPGGVFATDEFRVGVYEE